MIQQGPYVFRRGRTGDRNASGWVSVHKGRPPEFVLEFNGAQIGAAHGHTCCIKHIEIFGQHNKGHGTKFIELWEAYAKERCKELVVSPVTAGSLAHILEHKRGFQLRVDKEDAKTYVKAR